jgi:hypothetical protein
MYISSSSLAASPILSTLFLASFCILHPFSVDPCSSSVSVHVLFVDRLLRFGDRSIHPNAPNPLLPAASAPLFSYRSAALKWHPDRYVDRVSEQEVASAKFVLIAEGQSIGAAEGIVCA